MLLFFMHISIRNRAGYHMTLLKALANGLPISAMLAREQVTFSPGSHASTFGSTPVITAATPLSAASDRY